MWTRGKGVCHLGGRVVDAGVDPPGMSRENGDGGVRLEMGNVDIVIIIVTTDTTDNPRMAMTTKTIARMILDRTTLNVVIHIMETAMQTMLAGTQYPLDHEGTNHIANPDQKAITGD